MTIDEFDELFNRIRLEVLSEPEEVALGRFGSGAVSLEEAIALATQDAKDYAEKLVYRLLAEILVTH